MLATAGAQVCVPLGHSSLYFCIRNMYNLLRKLILYNNLCNVKGKHITAKSTAVR